MVGWLGVLPWRCCVHIYLLFVYLTASRNTTHTSQFATHTLTHSTLPPFPPLLCTLIHTTYIHSGQSFSQLTAMEGDIQRNLVAGEGDPEYWEVRGGLKGEEGMRGGMRGAWVTTY